MGVYPVDDGSVRNWRCNQILPVGLSIPEQPNHPGFDFLDVRLTAEEAIGSIRRWRPSSHRASPTSTARMWRTSWSSL